MNEELFEFLATADNDGFYPDGWDELEYIEIK